MIRSTHRLLRGVVSVALALAGMGFVPSAGVAGAVALEADDALPGVALESVTGYSATVTGTLDPPPTAGTPDGWDIYSVYVAEGEQLVVTLEGTGADFDLRLWAPSTVDPLTPKTVYGGFTESGSSSERICYTASAKWGSGRYFVVVDASDADAGAGSYTLKWNVSSRSDGNVPGVELVSSTVTGTVDTLWDLNDVYRIAASAGGSIAATLTADDPLDSLKLQFIDAKVGGTIVKDVYAGVSPVQDAGAVATVQWTLPEDGVYYLDVSAPDANDAGYTLEWSYTGGEMPGAMLRDWTAPASVDTTQVFAIDLHWGEEFSLVFSTDDGAEVSARMYAPGTLDAATATPVVSTDAALASGGLAYVVPEGEDGLYYVVLSPVSPGTVTPYLGTGPGLRRLAGATRYSTAAETCASAFPDGADVVVIASGMDFPDALSASGLAGAYGAPLLLTHSDYLPAEVADEIERLGATRAFVIGGVGAIGEAAFDAIDALMPTTPVRLAGEDRYATAKAVVEQVRLRRGLLDTVAGERIGFVARGDVFADALALAPLAWQEAAPVYLVRPAEVPTFTADALADYTPDALLIAGGVGAVSSEVETALADYAPVDRAAGVDRYATAVAVAEWGALRGSSSWGYIGVAVGNTFPDALAGGVAAGAAHGSLLLTPPAGLSTATLDALADHAQQSRRGRVYGGTGAVPAGAFGVLQSYFGLVGG